MINFGLSAREEAAIERVAKLDEVMIRHPAMEAALNGIQRCIAQTAHFKEPVGCMLLAEGGMGKSSVCKIIQRCFPSEDIQTTDAEITTVPVFHAEVPSTVSVSYLATNILAGLNDASPEKGTNAAKTLRIATLMRQCRTKIIFIDECHNLLNTTKNTAAANKTALRWIKSIANDSKACICLSGIPESEAIIDSDLSFQLTRRFKYRFQLQPLLPGSKENPGELYHFLSQMCLHIRERYALSHIPMIANYLDTFRVYAATHGNLSYVMALIKEALQQVLLKGGNSLSLEDLAAVWDTGLLRTASIAQQNPFRLGESALASEFRRLR